MAKNFYATKASIQILLSDCLCKTVIEVSHLIANPDEPKKSIPITEIRVFDL